MKLDDDLGNWRSYVCTKAYLGVQMQENPVKAFYVAVLEGLSSLACLFGTMYHCPLVANNVTRSTSTFLPSFDVCSFVRLQLFPWSSRRTAWMLPFIHGFLFWYSTLATGSNDPNLYL
jgi:hypothetical protein